MAQIAHAMGCRHPRPARAAGLLQTPLPHNHKKGTSKIINWHKIKEPIISIGLTTDRHHGEKPMIHINTPKGVFFVYPEDYKGVIQKARLE